MSIRTSQDIPTATLLLSDLLLKHGKRVGNFMPWHLEKEVYPWIIAETLLRRTTRKAVIPVYTKFIHKYHDWEALARAKEEDVAEIIAPIGLSQQRSKQLKAMALAVAGENTDSNLCNEQMLKQLPGIGDYTTNAILLYVCNKRTFPIDGNVKRLLNRVIYGIDKIRQGNLLPKKDPLTKSVAEFLIRKKTSKNLKLIHLGLLDVAWKNCKPIPQCSNCPLNSICSFFIINNLIDEHL